jgi:hypothetical protein
MEAECCCEGFEEAEGKRVKAGRFEGGGQARDSSNCPEGRSWAGSAGGIFLLAGKNFGGKMCATSPRMYRLLEKKKKARQKQAR